MQENSDIIVALILVDCACMIQKHKHKIAQFRLPL